MVDCAKKLKGAEPPPRLVLAWQCERYHVLPESGGLLDQSYREMFLNTAVISIYSAVVNWRTHGGTNLSPNDLSMIAWLVKTGAMTRKKTNV